ncbi:MAG: hypothetical protein NOM71_06505 [Archaeoglobi archaeon]|nr:hypothetical protein [Archaeoglobi archaeon]
MNKEVESLLATAGAAAAALMYLYPSIGAVMFALVLILAMVLAVVQEIIDTFS